MANFKRTNKNDYISRPIWTLFVCLTVFCLLNILGHKTQGSQCYGKKSLMSLTDGILTATWVKSYGSLELRNIRTLVNKSSVVQKIPSDTLIRVRYLRIHHKRKRGRRGEKSRKSLCTQINKENLISVPVTSLSEALGNNN